MSTFSNWYQLPTNLLSWHVAWRVDTGLWTGMAQASLIGPPHLVLSLYGGSSLNSTYYKVNLLLCHSQLGWSNKLFGLTKKNWSEKILVRKKFVRKKFWSEKFWSEKILVGKIFGRKKVLVWKKFWSEKIFGLKKFLVWKNVWSEKMFGLKKILVQKNI